MRLELNVRLLALVGALAALALAVFLVTLSRAQPSTTAEPTLRPPSDPRARPGNDARARAPKREAAARRASVRTRSGRSVRSRRAPAVAGLPPAIAAALARHQVVVVSLFVPGADVDNMAVKEARAGAALGGAGFVAASVLDERVAEPLSAVTTTLETPAVLVLGRSGKAELRIDGFADRQMVAQAATNAGR